MRVLVFGAAGMLGHAVVRVLAESPGLEVIGTLRNSPPAALATLGGANFLPQVSAGNNDSLVSAFAQARPDVVINCIGVVKQLAAADDPLTALPLNALLPHRLAQLCRLAGARLVHISTDCVFSGVRGGYSETDLPDATDLYGRSKLLGEVAGDGCVTLRTSIIGHELGTRHGLLEWFLAQPGPVRGYRRAIFSGLPTVELARIIRDHVLPNPALHGLYHVAAAPISKHDLLQLLGRAYGHDVDIVPDDAVGIDRSLDASRFNAATGYAPPPWEQLVRSMHDFR